MKKTRLLIISVIFTLLLSGCEAYIDSTLASFKWMIYGPIIIIAFAIVLYILLDMFKKNK